jgi:BPG-independent PGAM N-terminus (iPGM_N)
LKPPQILIKLPRDAPCDAEVSGPQFAGPCPKQRRSQDPNALAPLLLQGNGPDFVSDQWLEPFVITDARGEPLGRIEDGDAVICFNFRADRVVEISQAFEYPEFTGFDRRRWPQVGRPC